MTDLSKEFQEKSDAYLAIIENMRQEAEEMFKNKEIPVKIQTLGTDFNQSLGFYSTGSFSGSVDKILAALTDHFPHVIGNPLFDFKKHFDYVSIRIDVQTMYELNECLKYKYKVEKEKVKEKVVERPPVNLDEIMNFPELPAIPFEGDEDKITVKVPIVLPSPVSSVPAVFSNKARVEMANKELLTNVYLGSITLDSTKDRKRAEELKANILGPNAKRTYKKKLGNVSSSHEEKMYNKLASSSSSSTTSKKKSSAKEKKVGYVKKIYPTLPIEEINKISEEVKRYIHFKNFRASRDLGTFKVNAKKAIITANTKTIEAKNRLLEAFQNDDLGQFVSSKSDKRSVIISLPGFESPLVLAVESLVHENVAENNEDKFNSVISTTNKNSKNTQNEKVMNKNKAGSLGEAVLAFLVAVKKVSKVKFSWHQINVNEPKKRVDVVFRKEQRKDSNTVMEIFSQYKQTKFVYRKEGKMSIQVSSGFVNPLAENDKGDTNEGVQRSFTETSKRTYKKKAQVSENLDLNSLPNFLRSAADVIEKEGPNAKPPVPTGEKIWDRLVKKFGKKGSNSELYMTYPIARGKCVNDISREQFLECFL